MLRQEGVLPVDPLFVSGAITRAAERMGSDQQNMQAAFRHVLSLYARDAMWDEAERDLTSLRERGLISPGDHQGMLEQLEAGRRRHEKFVLKLRGE
jgi:hypothetical protein